MGRGLILLLMMNLPLNGQEAAGVSSYSREKEAALGAALAREVRRQAPPLPSATVQQYVADLGRLLAPGLKDSGIPFAFEVVFCRLTGATHEPMALPGGYVFVPVSLILEAHTEAELAGMLAHSMAHIAERHGIRAAAQRQAGNPATVPLIFMGGWDSDAARVLLPQGTVAAQRQFELLADRDAVYAMNAAGYNPKALVDYVARVQPRQGSERTMLPDPDTRIENLEQAIGELPPAEYRLGKQFESIQQEVRATVPEPEAEPPRPARPPTLKRRGQP